MNYRMLSGFFIHKRRPLLGYFVGLIPIYIPWQLFMLQVPGAEHCRQTPLACEWTGISVFIITGFTVLMMTVYSALSVSMAAYQRQASLKDVSTQVSRKTTFALTTIAVLAATSILGGGLGFSSVSLINSGVTDPAIRTIAAILGAVLGLVVGSVIVYRASVAGGPGRRV